MEMVSQTPVWLIFGIAFGAAYSLSADHYSRSQTHDHVYVRAAMLGLSCAAWLASAGVIGYICYRIKLQDVGLDGTERVFSVLIPVVVRADLIVDWAKRVTWGVFLMPTWTQACVSLRRIMRRTPEMEVMLDVDSDVMEMAAGDAATPNDFTTDMFMAEDALWADGAESLAKLAEMLEHLKKLARVSAYASAGLIGAVPGALVWVWYALYKGFCAWREKLKRLAIFYWVSVIFAPVGAVVVVFMSAFVFVGIVSLSVAGACAAFSVHWSTRLVYSVLRLGLTQMWADFPFLMHREGAVRRVIANAANIHVNVNIPGVGDRSRPGGGDNTGSPLRQFRPFPGRDARSRNSPVTQEPAAESQPEQPPAASADSVSIPIDGDGALQDARPENGEAAHQLSSASREAVGGGILRSPSRQRATSEPSAFARRRSVGFRGVDIVQDFTLARTGDAGVTPVAQNEPGGVDVGAPGVEQTHGVQSAEAGQDAAADDAGLGRPEQPARRRRWRRQGNFPPEQLADDDNSSVDESDDGVGLYHGMNLDRHPDEAGVAIARVGILLPTALEFALASWDGLKVRHGNVHMFVESSSGSEEVSAQSTDSSKSRLDSSNSRSLLTTSVSSSSSASLHGSERRNNRYMERLGMDAKVDTPRQRRLTIYYVLGMLVHLQVSSGGNSWKMADNVLKAKAVLDVDCFVLAIANLRSHVVYEAAEAALEVSARLHRVSRYRTVPISGRNLDVGSWIRAALLTLLSDPGRRPAWLAKPTDSRDDALRAPGNIFEPFIKNPPTNKDRGANQLRHAWSSPLTSLESG